MRGIKRTIPLDKVKNKDSRAVAFSKRSKGLYSKASKLCLLSGGQIAIIATPVSSNSNVSFYSFGHSSVDNVVAAFLANKHPRDDLGLGFWWEDESPARSENQEELRQAVNSMSKMLQDLKDLKNSMKKKGVLHGTTHQKQNLDVQSSSARNCIKDNTTANFQGFNKNTEEEQILAISDNNNNNNNQELGLLKVTTNQNLLSNSEVVEGGGELVMHNKDWYENNLHLSNFESQILSISENNNGNEAWYDQELDLDEIIDFETNCESLLMNDSEAVEDGGSVIHKDLDEDNLHFSDYFNELDSITEL